MNRKTFIQTFSAAAITLPVATSFAAVPIQDDPQLDKNLVKEFVGKSHRDMDTVKEMLAEYPTLLNAAYDWKMGDFETGLGAASHVGYKDLVQFFLDNGAQANIFTAALFGRLDILKPMLEFSPALLHAKGPHGFTLLHHASKGGDEATEVVDYLKSLGAKEMRIDLYQKT